MNSAANLIMCGIVNKRVGGRIYTSHIQTGRSQTRFYFTFHAVIDNF